MSTIVDAEVVAEGLQMAEGPVALSDGSVLVCEIAAGRIVRITADHRVEPVVDCGGGPNGAAIGPDGALYICNNGRRQRPAAIQRADLDSGAVTDVYLGCDDQPFLSPNDLVFDAAGGMWVTDTGIVRRRVIDRGAVYYALPDGSRITAAIAPVDTPNGIALGAHDSTLYYAETVACRVMRRDVASPGVLAPTTGVGLPTLDRGEPLDLDSIVARLPGYAMFDSMAVDAGGYLVIGTLLRGGLTVISPSGDVEHLDLPPALDDAFVTNICFGGADLRTAYVTLARTGRLIAFEWPRPGLRLNFNR